ncbi:MAG: hypothetical protein ACFFG0_18665 [Candidatus Thorarchaeota archaeon]
MDNQNIKEFNQKLLEWYKINKRKFPWRKGGKSIYEILIAEILLRKTTAGMVSEFFPNFINKYPNLKSIQEIPIEILERDLMPLGLYKTRAEIFKKIANEIIIKNNGIIPDEYEALISLYGIGKYIANAVLCFGYNKRAILVDTNIKRIFSRFLNKDYPIKINDNHPLWNELDNLITEGTDKIFFMALIDFGALVCKKRNYNCSKCPIFELCNYNQKSI